MIYAVDHIVCAVPSNEAGAVAEMLLGEGFRPTPLDLDFREIGAASRSYATASGIYVELVVEAEAGRAPRVWFSGAPRVMGLGFSSDDFERDVAAWNEPEEMWQMDEVHSLPDGSSFRIHAAGPHPHFEPFYVFMMDTPAPPYAHLGAEARLTRIAFSGSDAGAWQERLERWFGLQEPCVGDVELSFAESGAGGIVAVPSFALPGGVTLELFAS